MRRRHLFALAPAAGLMIGAARADTYPDRPVRIVSPSGPGGITDVVARLLAEGFQTKFGQRFLVENKPGASGTIAAHAAARSPADGYTLFVGLLTTQVIQPAVRELPYDAHTAFAPVGVISVSPLVLAVNPSLPVRSVQDLVSLSREKKGALNFSIAATATLPHLLFEMLVRETGLSGQAVAYNDSAPSLRAVISGEVAGTFEGILIVRSQVAAGTLRALAVTSPSRHPTLPDVPTMAELGFPNFTVSAWSGLFAPANTPASRIGVLNKNLNTIADTEEFRSRLADLGADPQPGSPEALATLIADEKRRWADILAKMASSLK